MSLHLAPVVGSGTDEDPYRPGGVDNLASWAMLDLRAPADRDGWCVVGSTDPLPERNGVTRLAEHPSERSQASRRALRSALGVEVPDVGVGRMLTTLLLDGRTDGTRWRPLMPNREARRYELWIGELIDTLPWVAGGALVADDFNRANGSLGGAWALTTGTQVIDSNQLRSAGGSALHGTTLASDDMAVSINLNNVSSARPAIGTLVRISVAGLAEWGVGTIKWGVESSGFAASNAYNGRWRDDDGIYEIYRFAGTDFTPPSSATRLATLAAPRPAVGARLTTSAVGSTIRCAVPSEGINFAVTSTTYPTGRGHGIREGRNLSAWVDNYEAVEV